MTAADFWQWRGRVARRGLAGIGVAAIVHGWVPENFLASFMGKSAWWSVPLAVLIGVPMYTSTATPVPLVQALLAKGAALGTASPVRAAQPKSV